MNNKFKQILSALEELPELNQLGNLKIYHLIILKLIQKHQNLTVKEIVSNPELSQISQAQRYRYIDNLIDQKIIQLQSNGILTFA